MRQIGGGSGRTEQRKSPTGTDRKRARRETGKSNIVLEVFISLI